MTLPDAARAWVSRIVALEDALIRAHQVAGDMGRIDPRQVVGMLADIQDALAQGEDYAAGFMLGVQDVMAQDLLAYEHRVALYKAAAEAGLTRVQRLILAPQPARKETSHKPKRPPEGAETLGMRTWTARTTTNIHGLDRLLRDPDPRVIRNVLINPRLTEKDVLKIASRRPVVAEVLEEVARSPRWNRRDGVRRALVFNPYTLVETAVGFLPFIHRQDLLIIINDGKVHPEVARHAAAIAQFRPPVPPPQPPSTRQVSAANDDLEHPLGAHGPAKG